MKPYLILFPLILQSCTTFTHYTPGCMTVDVSEKKAMVAGVYSALQVGDVVKISL